MATNIPDEKLFQFSKRVVNQTVIITGAASGIGRETALQFARFGANVVIGDINSEGAQKVVEEITADGGKAISQKCNVLDFNSQIDLFELAVGTFGKVDVVIPNAGAAEPARRITDIKLDTDGRPLKPDLFCLNLNYDSAIYTAYLAIHYFSKNQDVTSLRAIVMVASMLGFTSMPGAIEYCTSKHGIIGFVRAINPILRSQNIRIASVCPWFVDTPLVPDDTKTLLAGIPFSPIHRVAGAAFLAATDPLEVEVKTEKEGVIKISTLGAAYTIPDDREVYRIPNTEISEGVYALLNNRVRNIALIRKVQTLRTVLAYMKLVLGGRLSSVLVGVGLIFSLYRVIKRISPR